jgi:hypothetical protein
MRAAKQKQPRTKVPVVKRRRGGGYDVVVACDGVTRKNADLVAKLVRSFLRAYQQSSRGGVGAVRLNDMSDVLYSVGLVLDMRMMPQIAATDSPAGASVLAVDPSWSTPDAPALTTASPFPEHDTNG